MYQDPPLRHGSPASQRPMHEQGEAGRSSPPSAQLMPPSPIPKRRASTATRAALPTARRQTREPSERGRSTTTKPTVSKRRELELGAWVLRLIGFFAPSRRHGLRRHQRPRRRPLECEQTQILDHDKAPHPVARSLGGWYPTCFSLLSDPPPPTYTSPPPRLAPLARRLSRRQPPPAPRADGCHVPNEPRCPACSPRGGLIGENDSGTRVRQVHH